MKVIIAGSRTITDIKHVRDAISSYDMESKISEVVSGTAGGVDSLGETWAIDNNKILTKFPANWKLYGKGAGYKRNVQMAEYADILIAIWDGKSRGTNHMINIARKHQLLVCVYNINSLPLFRV